MILHVFINVLRLHLIFTRKIMLWQYIQIFIQTTSSGDSYSGPDNTRFSVCFFVWDLNCYSHYRFVFFIIACQILFDCYVVLEHIRKDWHVICLESILKYFFIIIIISFHRLQRERAEKEKLECRYRWPKDAHRN